MSYYEHGTFLTLAHGHASMFGVFGLLALGLVYLALPVLTSRDRWSDRLSVWVLRLFNASIVLWLALNLVPIGVGQFLASANHGYWYARSLGFYEHWTAFQWLRMIGDAAFLAAGVLMLLDVGHKILGRRRPTVEEGGRVRAPQALAEYHVDGRDVARSPRAARR